MKQDWSIWTVAGDGERPAFVELKNGQRFATLSIAKSEVAEMRRPGFYLLYEHTTHEKVKVIATAGRCEVETI